MLEWKDQKVSRPAHVPAGYTEFLQAVREDIQLQIEHSHVHIMQGSGITITLTVFTRCDEEPEALGTQYYIGPALFDELRKQNAHWKLATAVVETFLEEHNIQSADDARLLGCEND